MKISTNLVQVDVSVTDRKGNIVRDLKAEDFEVIRKKVPVLCDLKPSGKYVATDLHQAGGIPLIMKTLLDHGYLHGDCPTVTGSSLHRPCAPRPGNATCR